MLIDKDVMQKFHMPRQTTKAYLSYGEEDNTGRWNFCTTGLLLLFGKLV